MKAAGPGTEASEKYEKTDERNGRVRTAYLKMGDAGRQALDRITRRLAVVDRGLGGPLPPAGGVLPYR